MIQSTDFDGYIMTEYEDEGGYDAVFTVYTAYCHDEKDLGAQ